jgi:class 3 adenylate cyclase/outer membrane protein OmpA-like peptidoglycan-associated protein
MNLAAQERTERRLAAILTADVVGYSRLMGEDEEGTHAAFKVIRGELVDPRIREHRGRIVKTTGDGLLVEFASVVDAVRCAVAVQSEMAQRNAGVPAERRIEFRMGINLGDIIIDGDDIFGDGVNVAARLEPLAEPGGICVSQVVRDQVRDKLGFAFEDMGDRQVKNIARPVRVFRIPIAQNAAPIIHASTRSRAKFIAGDYYLRLKRRIDLRSLAIIICVAVSGTVLPRSLEAPLRSMLVKPEQVPPVAQVPAVAENRSIAAPQPAHPAMIGDPVRFEKDTVILSQSAGLTIDRQAEFLRDNPKITVTIEGHCSEDEGAREGPSILAQLRANQVRNAFKARGVAESRIRTVNYGNTRPAVFGDSETAHEQNRRVVVLQN